MSGFLGLEGKVVLISGTARGQGRVAAEAFAAEGAVVVGGDVAPAAGERQLDVTDPVSAAVTGANILVDGGWSAVLHG